MTVSPQSTTTQSAGHIRVAALYKFVRIDDAEAARDMIYALCDENRICGTILVAREGINGTIAGTQHGIHQVLEALRNDARFRDLSAKFSHAETLPFHRLKVRLKREIVTMGKPDIDPNKIVGTYVKPQDWNALISDPDVLVIDTRNSYEIGIGTFEHAIDPQTKSFREFPAWFAQLKADIAKGDRPAPKKIAMFCTGGIRCEKSTAYVKDQGFDDVYHLEGGILKYLEEIPQSESLWRGECFVFDQRVSVGHGLTLGHYDQCHGCRHPITDEDKASPLYVLGVSCPNCYDETSGEQKQRYAARQKQMELADARGDKHIGAVRDQKQRNRTA